MAKLNLKITKALARELAEYMEVRGLDNEEEALRLALQESTSRAYDATTHSYRLEAEPFCY